MTKTALLIIDLQNDFLPPDGSLAVANGRDIINPIINLMTSSEYHWDTIVATKDWHPSDHISFAVTHGLEPYSTKELSNPTGSDSRKLLHTLWPVHCVQESKGSDFPTEFKEKFMKQLAAQEVPTKIVLKGYLQDREYYSCFQDVWGIHKTECSEYLKDNEITDIVAVGIAYDFCVMNSCIDAVKNGFNVYVMKDMTKSVFPEKDAETTSNYIKHGIKVIDSNDEITKQWK